VTSRRAVLLGGVSTSDGQQDPENQLGPLRAAAVRLGWTVVDEVALKMSAWDESSAAEVRRRALPPIVQGRADTSRCGASTGSAAVVLKLPLPCCANSRSTLAPTCSRCKSPSYRPPPPTAKRAS
jgi:hypothetical protein